MLERRGAALSGVVSLVALALCGCALSFEDSDGRRQVIGLFDMSSARDDSDALANDVRHFVFYGLWVDDTFRGPSVALGEVELSVADLRNRWQGGEVAESAAPQDVCDGGFGFRWCSLAPRDAARAGEAFDIAVAGVSIGVGDGHRHFGIGYHRQVLIEVTNENALVTWSSPLTLRPDEPKLARRSLGEDGPAHVGLENLLRGTFNG